jgi:hypothetical protein
MPTTLEQFEQAARDLHDLSAFFDMNVASDVPPILTEEWINRFNRVLQRGGAGVADPSAPRSAPEVAHYRGELLKMKQALGKYEQALSTNCARIRSEQARIKRVHAWANAAEFLR